MGVEDIKFSPYIGVYTVAKQVKGKTVELFKDGIKEIRFKDIPGVDAKCIYCDIFKSIMPAGRHIYIQGTQIAYLRHEKIKGNTVKLFTLPMDFTDIKYILFYNEKFYIIKNDEPTHTHEYIIQNDVLIPGPVWCGYNSLSGTDLPDDMIDLLHRAADVYNFRPFFDKALNVGIGSVMSSIKRDDK